jgi:hypothetical protein
VSESVVVVQRKGVQDYIRVCHNSRRALSRDDLGLMQKAR